MKLWNRNKEQRTAKRLPLFTYLAYLLAATMVFTGVTFSGYVSTTTGGDEAHVAAFNVSAAAVQNQTDLALDLSSATTKKSVSYSFTVANSSEVKAVYTVTVTLPSALPTGVTMSMKRGESPMPPTVSDNRYMYSSSELDFTDTHTWTLCFTGDPTAVTANTILKDIRVSVAAEQID